MGDRQCSMGEKMVIMQMHLNLYVFEPTDTLDKD